MLKKLRIVFSSILSLVFAPYLGFAFSDIFLKPFIPHSLATPSGLLCGVGFFFVLRWLRTNDPTPARKPKIEIFPTVRSATAPQRFIRWESLYSRSPLLEAHAFSELTGLMAQSHFPGNSQREQIEGIVACATTK